MTSFFDNQWTYFRQNLGEWHGSFAKFSADGEAMEELPTVVAVTAEENDRVQVAVDYLTNRDRNVTWTFGSVPGDTTCFEGGRVFAGGPLAARAVECRGGAGIDAPSPEGEIGAGLRVRQAAKGSVDSPSFGGGIGCGYEPVEGGGIGGGLAGGSCQGVGEVSGTDYFSDEVTGGGGGRSLGATDRVWRSLDCVYRKNRGVGVAV